MKFKSTKMLLLHWNSKVKQQVLSFAQEKKNMGAISCLEKSYKSQFYEVRKSVTCLTLWVYRQRFDSL